MKRLGYTRFVAQGGDWGAVIVDLMGVQAPPELLAIHTNMPGVLPPEIAIPSPAVAQPAPAGLSAEEQRCYVQVSDVFTREESATGVQRRRHPQTLYGIADSPVCPLLDPR